MPCQRKFESYELEIYTGDSRKTMIPRSARIKIQFTKPKHKVKLLLLAWTEYSAK